MLTSPIIDEHPPEEWQQNIPERAGWWDMRCDQNGQQSERVEITGRPGALFVECRHTGFRPLLRAHSGLTNVSWLDPLIQGRTNEVGASRRPGAPQTLSWRFGCSEDEARGSAV
jgi:hypothetical protein